MGSQPCPTGGRDKGDGSFCEACGVYNHAEAARQRRSAALPVASPARSRGAAVELAIKVAVIGAMGLVLLTRLINKAESLRDRVPPASQAVSAPSFDPDKYVKPARNFESQRAWSPSRQAEVNRRLDEALKSRPPEKPKAGTQERRKKIEAARQGLGL